MSDSLSSRTGLRIERDASSELLRGRTGTSIERGTGQPYAATWRMVEQLVEEQVDTISSSQQHTLADEALQQHSPRPQEEVSAMSPPQSQSAPEEATAATAPSQGEAQQAQPATTFPDPPEQAPSEAQPPLTPEAGAPSSLSQLFASFMNSMRNVAGLAEQTQPLHPADANTSDENPSQSETRPAPSVLYFRLPFNGPDGNPALLAFHPMPLPPTSNDTPAQPADGAFPHPAGHVPRAPLFVPFGASPLPFSFIYDAPTNTAWSIAQIVLMTPPGGPSPDSPQAPQLVAGPPFRIILDLRFTPPPSPDPHKASSYVDSLEKADSDLRHRLSLLGGDSSPLSCGVCLENYGEEDRPDWIASKYEGVVAVPCRGHHTLHKKCLADWLSRTVKWSCPFCRDELGGEMKETLREQVRRKEREKGWRCDAPACLPRYPGEEETKAELVRLAPCRHEVHLDCLCTSIRVETDLCDAKVVGMEDEGQERTGKWVTCPCCRKESWAPLPLGKKP